MAAPESFKDLLPKKKHEDWKGPLYWLFVFDPEDAKAHLEDNEDRHPAEHLTHQDMHPEITHPSRLNGYVYKIQGGYRITDDHHKPITDPFVKKQIKKALDEKYPPQPLPKLNDNND